MVKRKIKLAQIVCAVYALNKPSGASKKEIIRFCKRTYGITCKGKEFDRLLDRGLNEGLLSSFNKRYRVTKLRCAIVWAGGRVVVHGRKRAKRGKNNKNTKALVRKKGNTTRKLKSNLKRRVLLETDCVKSYSNLKQTLPLYLLWKRELQRARDRMKKSKVRTSKRPKSICKKSRIRQTKSKTSRPKLRRLSFKRKVNKNRKEKVYNATRQKMKNSLKSRQIHKRKGKENSTKGSTTKVSKKVCKKSGSTNSRASTSSIGATSERSEFHRSLLRQTKHSVVHGKSWDTLNFTRQRRIRENQKMVKNSQLIQKILTQKHAASWDDLNSKLKQMKEVASCSPHESRASGDGTSRQSL